MVAACSPRMHEPTFRKALAKAGLNPYFLEMANIREQCSWVHDDAVMATDKARALVKAAVLRVAFHEALERRSVDMCPTHSSSAAASPALPRRSSSPTPATRCTWWSAADHLGGNLVRVDLTAPYLDSARDMLTERITRVLEHANIDVLLESQVRSVEGFVGNFKTTIRSKTESARRTMRPSTWAA